MEQGQDYDKKGGGLLVAAWIFSLLGGWLGIVFDTVILTGKVRLEDGTEVKKYNESARNSARIALIVSIIVMFLGYIVRYS